MAKCGGIGELFDGGLTRDTRSMDYGENERKKLPKMVKDTIELERSVSWHAMPFVTYLRASGLPENDME